MMTWDDCTEDWPSDEPVPNAALFTITPETAALEMCECGCDLWSHDMIGETGECLECWPRCLRWRPVRA